jgi:hypothetical protein
VARATSVRAAPASRRSASQLGDGAPRGGGGAVEGDGDVESRVGEGERDLASDADRAAGDERPRPDFAIRRPRCHSR